MTIDEIEHTTGLFQKKYIQKGFILFMVRCFFLLIHFLVVEDYQLPKSTSLILSLPLTLE